MQHARIPLTWSPIGEQPTGLTWINRTALHRTCVGRRHIRIAGEFRRLASRCVHQRLSATGANCPEQLAIVSIRLAGA